MIFINVTALVCSKLCSMAGRLNQLWVIVSEHRNVDMRFKVIVMFN